MSYRECPNPNPECKYYSREPVIEGSDSGCYSDSHHIYPRGEFKFGMARDFARLGENVIQLCREAHDNIHIEGEVPPLPPREVMAERLVANGIKKYERYL